MKKTLSLISFIVLISSTFSVTAQIDSTMDANLPNFLLPHFTRGTVKFKVGENKTALLNYNVVDQEMIFKQPDGYMVLDNPQVVDTIFIEDRKFVPFTKGFYEVLATGKVTLYMQYKSSLEIAGTPTGYGATSKTTGPTYVRQLYGPISSVNLKLPDEYKISEVNDYWVKKEDGTMERFANKRQFYKIFKEKEKELTQFIDRNNTSFKKTAEVAAVIKYYNQLN